MMNLFRDSQTRKKWLFSPAVLPAALFVFSTCMSSPAGVEEHQWSYQGSTGPEHWYALSPEYGIAKDGKAQSPIDIVTADLTADAAVGKPVITYGKALFELENNGHTIEAIPVAADGQGNSIALDGKTYVLQQFHFHAPSEHLFDGTSFAIELHLVHKSSQNDMAVIGVMITEGARNETLMEVFDNLPSDESLRPEVEVNLDGLFPDGWEAYRYDGSLTTPPCTEGVKWTVRALPITMSRSQIDAFRVLYDGNRRHVQNRYGRQVYWVK